MTIKSFKDLQIWQKSRVLVSDIYKITQNFPKEEMYGLTSQIRRCAVSIPSNIAEGRSRNTKKEFQYFLGIAYGSLAELETQLIISCDLEYLDDNNLIELTGKISEIGRMINGLDSSLNKSLTPETRNLEPV